MSNPSFDCQFICICFYCICFKLVPVGWNSLVYSRIHLSINIMVSNFTMCCRCSRCCSCVPYGKRNRRCIILWSCQVMWCIFLFCQVESTNSQQWHLPFTIDLYFVFSRIDYVIGFMLTNEITDFSLCSIECPCIGCVTLRIDINIRIEKVIIRFDCINVRFNQKVNVPIFGLGWNNIRCCVRSARQKKSSLARIGSIPGCLLVQEL